MVGLRSLARSGFSLSGLSPFLLLGAVGCVPFVDSEAQGGRARAAPCVQDTSTPAPGPDDRTGLGFSLNELTAAVTGPRQATMTWHDRRPSIQTTPAASTTALSLEVTPTAPARYIRMRRADGPVTPGGCFDRAEIDAAVRFQTADGAFDETWSVTLVTSLVAAGMPMATWLVDLATHPPRGTFRAMFAALEPDAKVSLRLDGQVFAGRTEGRISIEKTIQRGASGFGEGTFVADWR
jgi:hypothetical protein